MLQEMTRRLFLQSTGAIATGLVVDGITGSTRRNGMTARQKRALKGLPDPIQAYRMGIYSKDLDSFGENARAVRRHMTQHDWNYPLYHLCPPEGQLSIPGPTLYHNGKFHLFYCHDIVTSESAKILHCLGHAVSEDQVHWRDYPVAIWPDHKEDRGGVIKGQAVIKAADVSSLLYTAITSDAEESKMQAICYDDDLAIWLSKTNHEKPIPKAQNVGPNNSTYHYQALTGPASPNCRTEQVTYWQGSLALPCLRKEHGGGQHYEPIPAIEKLRGSAQIYNEITVDGAYALRLSDFAGDAYEVNLHIKDGIKKGYAGVKVRAGRHRDSGIPIVYHINEQELQVGTQRESVKHEPSRPIDLRIFVDRSIVEVFLNGQRLATQVYTKPEERFVSLLAHQKVSFTRVSIWPMRSLWG